MTPTSTSCFPVGIGVFRSGGDLAFHHGGPSLQEMIVPVITVRSATSVAQTPVAAGCFRLPMFQPRSPTGSSA